MSFNDYFADVVSMHGSCTSLYVISRRAYTRDEAAKRIQDEYYSFAIDEAPRPEQLEEAWVKYGFWGEENEGEGESCWHTENRYTKGCMPVWIWEKI